MFNFGAIARARAAMLGGQYEGQQERYRRDQQADAVKRQEAAQAFARWAQEQQLARQAERDTYSRQRVALGDARLREQDQLDAIRNGGEDAPEMVGAQLLAGMNAMRGSGGNTAFRVGASKTAPFRQTVAGVDVQAPDMGAPTYGTAGGRTFRFDRQRAANAKTQGEALDLAAQDARDRRTDQRAEARDARAMARSMALLQAKGQQVAAGRPLPSMLADKLGSYNALIGTATDALTKFDAARTGENGTPRNVTGLLTGAVTGKVGQALGFGREPAAISARAALSNVASSIMKDRSGGAITPQEFQRLDPFLPSRFDDENVARQKLVDLIAELERIKAERLDALEGSGYDVSVVRGGTASRRPARPEDVR